MRHKKKKVSRKMKEGGWYSERRRQSLATSSYCSGEWDSRRRNSSYVSVQCHFCSAESLHVNGDADTKGTMSVCD